MYILYAILTSPGPLRGLTRPYKGALQPATSGFRVYVQRRQEMAPPTKGRQRHFPAEEMALTAVAAIHIVVPTSRTLLNRHAGALP